MIAAGVLGSADLTSSESECGAPSVLLLRSVTVAPDLTVMSPGTNFCPSCRYSLILTLASPWVSIVFGFGLGAAARAGPATASAATVARIGVRRSIRASWMRTASPASGKSLNRRGDAALQHVRQLVDRDPLLLQRVAVAQRDRAVLDRLVIDRDRVRRADLVLAPVAPADRAAVVVLGAHPPPQRLVDLARELGVAALAQQRQDRHLHGGDRRMQPQHRPRLAAELVGVVGLAEQREDRAPDAGRGLDHVRDVALARLRVLPLELLARVLGVLGEVEVAAVGHALQLRPADRVQVLDVGRPARVVRELLGVVLAQAQALARDAQARVPVQPLLAPVVVPLLGLVRRDEELHLHLLELERAEDEVAGRDLVAERLAHLRDPERGLLARVLERLLEVEEDALRRLRPQVDRRARLRHRAHVRAEHEVEVARVGEVAAALRALELALGLALAEVVGAPAPLALAQALDERVAEAGEVARCLPS